MKLSKLKFNKKFIFLIIFLFIIAFSLWLFLRPYRTLVLLQNTDEVRATGGFLGSVAIIEHQAFKIKTFTFHDIYNLDHQLMTFQPAPPGVRQYLSGGRDTLHLQDANWERDFPSSAQQISDLIVTSGQKKPDIILALNSSLIANLLTYLADYNLSISVEEVFLNSDNFSTAARADHHILALNRQPKTRFLQNFKTQLLSTLSSLNFDQRLKLIHFIWMQKNDRQWQIYSRFNSYQKLFQLLGIAGHTQASLFHHQIYFFSSNVGINKSNKSTKLELKLVPANQKTATATLHAKFINDNPLDEDALITQRLHFANYQRLLLPPNVTLKSISFNQQAITEYDQRLVIDSSGHHWQEIGFLIIINEQSYGDLEIVLAGPQKRWVVN